MVHDPCDEARAPAPGPDDEPELPPELPYRVVSVLGTGSTATVYRAAHVTHGGEVALKVFRRPFAAEDADRFRSECELQWRLSDHLNVVRLLEASSATADRPWAVMQLYDFSLAQARPATPRWTPASAARWSLDLVRGLAAVHEAGHLHRDVKPSNVLVKDGIAALSDFGCALGAADRVTDRATGTQGFLAPELTAGGTPSPRSDVYSAAVTVARLLGDDRPTAVENLLVRATSHDPADRPADAAAFLAALESVLPDVDVLDDSARDLVDGADEPTARPGEGSAARHTIPDDGRRTGRLLFPAAVVLAAGLGVLGGYAVDRLVDGGPGGTGMTLSGARTGTGTTGGAAGDRSPAADAGSGATVTQRPGVTATASGTELERLPVSAEDDVVPRADGAPTYVDVSNRSAEPVRIYWRDYAGVRVLLDIVAPGRGTRISARESFTFLFADTDGRPLFVVVTPATPGRVELAAV